MSPETIKILEAFAKDVSKAVDDTRLIALRAVIIGHVAAIAGVASGMPKGENVEILDQAISMLTESRDAIGAMK